jgi:hypothetical protein
MFRIAADVKNRDDEIVAIEVVFDTEGVLISRNTIAGEKTLHLTHDEAEMLHDLFNLARPAYKAKGQVA